jgi:hypothetical protein
MPTSLISDHAQIAKDLGIITSEKPKNTCATCKHRRGYGVPPVRLSAILGKESYGIPYQCAKLSVGFDLIEGNEQFQSCVIARQPDHCGVEGRWYEEKVRTPNLDIYSGTTIGGSEPIEIVFDEAARKAGAEAAAKALADAKLRKQQAKTTGTPALKPTDLDNL